MKKNTTAAKPLTLCYYGTYDREYTSNKLIMAGLRENGVIIKEVNAHIPVTRLDKPTDMSWWHLLRRIIQKYQIIPTTIKHWQDIKASDAIYVGYPGHFDVFFAWLAAKLAHKKLVFNPLLIIYVGFSEEQGILSKQSLLGKGIKWFESLAYQACDLVFADTPFQESFLIDVFGVSKEKLRVVAIGADDKYYAFTPYTNVKKTLNVVYYGLYSPIHGVEYIIEAANALKNDPDIRFTMVGNGNTFAATYQRAKDLKLTNMTFHHDKPLSEHPAIIQKGDVFLGFLAKHPTVDRVIPNKVYQGLALNKVVLTADAPVTRSVFKHKENVYLVKPANSKALTAAIRELKDNPTLRKRIAAGGYELFVANYTPKAVGAQLRDAIVGIL